MKKEEFKKEQNPYQSDKLAKIPSWIKILLLKYWAAAAAFFFFAVANPIAKGVDQYFIWISFGLGLFLEYIVKSIVRLMKNSRDNTYRFNLVNKKGVVSLFLNMIYAFAIMLPMYMTLAFLAEHHLVVNMFALEDVPALEPITAGVVFVFYDAIVVGIKNLILYLWKNHKYKAEQKETARLIDNFKNKKE